MTAYITGAGSGIGRAAADHFAGRGVATVLLDRAGETLESVASRLASGGAQCRAYGLDVSDAEQVEVVFARARAEAGPASILINAAGVAAGGAALDMPLAIWRRVMDVNVTGTYLCARAAAGQMIAAGSKGRVINFTSSLALLASEARAAYGTAKTAVIGLTRQLAVEWAPYGVTVNAIAPGLIETPMTARLSEPFRATYNARNPVGRTGEVADIVAAIDYLASDVAGYVNGHVLVVDGGFASYGLPNL